MEMRAPVPPFTEETATQKVRMAEDTWNTRDPERVSLAYTIDSSWRNRHEFLSGREAIVQFLQRKWAKELDYRLIKELWAFHGSRIAVRFAYEWHDDSSNGSVPTVMKIGNLTSKVLCGGESRVSTTFRSRKLIASTIGHWGDVRKTIQVCQTLGYRPLADSHTGACRSIYAVAVLSLITMKGFWYE